MDTPSITDFLNDQLITAQAKLSDDTNTLQNAQNSVANAQAIVDAQTTLVAGIQAQIDSITPIATQITQLQTAEVAVSVSPSIVAPSISKPII